MKKLFTVTMMMILLFTIGCGSNKDKIIGKWNQDDWSIEFLDDGTVLVGGSQGTSSGQWSILDDGRLKAEVSGETSLYKVSFKDDDTMDLVLDGSGETFSFARIKEQDSTVSNDQSAPTTAEAIQISIQTLRDEYSANKFKADSKYKGKLLLTTGKIVSIGKDIFNDDAPVVVLSDPANQFKVLGCHFDKEDASVVANLTRGQTITVAGFCEESGTGPDLLRTVVQ